MLKMLRQRLNQWSEFKSGVKQTRYWAYLLIDLVETVVVALFFALIIRTFVIQTSMVFSGSMEPTMQVGDRLFVNKFIYHFRVPRRLEIILFNSPYHDQKEFVKRLIGLPGEKVEIVKGDVYINDQLLILSGINYNKDYDSWGPKVVPAGHYFVLGDNRSNSADSRVWGYVDRNDLVGKAMFNFWPFSRMQVLR